MTFQFKSDILWTYGNIRDKETNAIIAPSMDPKWKPIDEKFNKTKFMNVFLKKTKEIAWIVSNCGLTSSSRNEISWKIQEHIKVDIFGKCGQLR